MGANTACQEVYTKIVRLPTERPGLVDKSHVPLCQVLTTLE